MKPKTLFGEFFKQKRIEGGTTLREFCRKNGLDPGNLSKIERGLLAPPSSREKLEEYASYLQLKPGTDDWIEFFDRAAACKGVIPEEFLQDDELVAILPLIFRTIRGKKVSQEVLNDLADKLKRL